MNMLCEKAYIYHHWIGIDPGGVGEGGGGGA